MLSSLLWLPLVAADLVKELAGRLHVPYEIIPAADARHVIGTLHAHAADIGFLAFDPSRAEEVDFSQPYAVMYNTYLVRADSSIHKAADVDTKGVRVGTVKGQTQEIYLSSHLRSAEVKILTTMPPLDELETMMLTGEIDAFGANRQRMEEAAALHPKLRVLPDNLSGRHRASPSVPIQPQQQTSTDNGPPDPPRSDPFRNLREQRGKSSSRDSSTIRFRLTRTSSIERPGHYAKIRESWKWNASISSSCAAEPGRR